MSGPQQAFTERDPRHHTAKIKEMLDKTTRHCGEGIPKITEPKAQILFETTAEVLKSLSPHITTTRRPKSREGVASCAPMPWDWWK